MKEKFVSVLDTQTGQATYGQTDMRGTLQQKPIMYTEVQIQERSYTLLICSSNSINS